MRLRWLACSEEDLPPDDGWLGPWELERAAGMRYAKRRNDYLLGRWTAKHALALAHGLPSDLPLHTLEVRNAPSGAPRAHLRGEPLPQPFSMTDRAGWAVCAVLLDGSGSVGCDLELVEPRTSGFVQDYLTPAERALVTAASGEEHALLANLMWSAKESALKVLETGLRRDTRSVEVRLAGDWSGPGWHELAVTAAEGPRFPGWWRRFADFVLTITADRAVPAPEPLDGCERLHGAVPTHRWMERPVD